MVLFDHKNLEVTKLFASAFNNPCFWWWVYGITIDISYSLLWEIRSAVFWVPTGVTGLLSAVSCMRSLMMACLSTDPAGAPGLVSGNSCGNWLFCKSSKISSKLSSSLPGCSKWQRIYPVPLWVWAPQACWQLQTGPRHLRQAKDAETCPPQVQQSIDDLLKH